MKPDLQFSVLCDDVRREDNGKLMLIGLFEVIAGLEFPLAYPGMAVVNRWCNGVGEFRQRVRLVDADNKTVVETADSPLVLPDMRASVTAVSILRNIQFAKPGRYAVEILLDGDLKQRFALGAVKVAMGGELPPWAAPPPPPAG